MSLSVFRRLKDLKIYLFTNNSNGSHRRNFEDVQQ